MSPRASRPNRPASRSRVDPAPAPGDASQPSAGPAALPATVARPAGSPAAVELPAGSPAAVEADGLEKAYGEVLALHPLDLAVARGECVVLVGHNGSGKTTLLRLAAGLLEPTGGQVTVCGHPAGSLGARAALSYLSDNPTFYDDLSVWEHLEYVARLHGMDESWEQRAADLLGHLGIYERGDDLPSRFSRGLRQKAQLALGFLRPFDVLCIDEPFVGLDAAGKVALLELLDDAVADGATVVVATHELEFVRRPTVSRCLALRDGQLVHDGSPRGIDVVDLVT